MSELKTCEKPQESATKVELTEVDRVVASFFGEANEESMTKAHAAITAAIPMLMDSNLRPSGLHGKELRKHITNTTIKAMKEYRKEVGVTLKELRDDIQCIKEWDIDSIGDWFYVWDALGSTGVNVEDKDMADFYRFAGLRWHYRKMG
jgi:hypothetical protein